MGNVLRPRLSRDDVITCLPVTVFNLQADLRCLYQLVDCRSPHHYAAGHIDLALNHSDASSLIVDIFQYYPEYIILYTSAEESDEEKRFMAQVISHIADRLHSDSRSIIVYTIQGGYEGYQETYPALCSDHPRYASGRLFPSQITPRLFLSNYGIASNPDVLKSLSITHVVNCTIDCDFAPELSEEFCLRIPVIDSQDQSISKYFDQAVQFISHALESDRNSAVIVHCKHGQSRSATIVAAWMISTGQYSTASAVEHLKQCRPKVRPNSGFLAQLDAYEEKVTQHRSDWVVC